MHDWTFGYSDFGFVESRLGCSNITELHLKQKKSNHVDATLTTNGALWTFGYSDLLYSDCLTNTKSQPSNEVYGPEGFVNVTPYVRF